MLLILFLVTCAGSQTRIDTRRLNSFQDPAYSYLSLGQEFHNRYFDGRTGDQAFAASSATGVVVAKSEEGYYALTAKHFCENDAWEEDVERLRRHLRPQVEREYGDMGKDIVDEELDSWVTPYAINSAEGLQGGEHDWVVVDTHPSLDLCLIEVLTDTKDYESTYQFGSATLLERARDAYGLTGVPLYSVGLPSPHSMFEPPPLYYLAQWHGHWAGYFQEGMLATTIKVRGGQSGAGLYYEGYLIGVMVAYNSRVDISYAPGPMAIQELLWANGILVEFAD